MSVKELKNSLNLSWHETFHKCETEHIASALTAILALSVLITCSVYAAQSGFSENIEWYYLGIGISGAVLLVDMLFIVDQVLDCLKPPQAEITPPSASIKIEELYDPSIPEFNEEEALLVQYLEERNPTFQQGPTCQLKTNENTEYAEHTEVFTKYFHFVNAVFTPNREVLS